MRKPLKRVLTQFLSAWLIKSAQQLSACATVGLADWPLYVLPLSSPEYLETYMWIVGAGTQLPHPLQRASRQRKRKILEISGPDHWWPSWIETTGGSYNTQERAGGEGWGPGEEHCGASPPGPRGECQPIRLPPSSEEGYFPVLSIKSKSSLYCPASMPCWLPPFAATHPSPLPRWESVLALVHFKPVASKPLSSSAGISLPFFSSSAPSLLLIFQDFFPNPFILRRTHPV